MSSPTHIYINGRRRQIAEGFGPSFFVDTDSLPGRRCSQHNVGVKAHFFLLSGLTVRTLGNTYSLEGPEWSEFTLDGIKGKVFADGRLSWGTVNCDVTCTLSAELRQIVDRLYGELQERAKKRN